MINHTEERELYAYMFETSEEETRELLGVNWNRWTKEEENHYA